MRIARFRTPDGRILTGRLLSEQAAEPLIGGLFGEREFSPRPETVASLLAPLDPPNIFAIGRNYPAHAAETGARLPEEPMIFMKPTTSVLPPGGTIELPPAAPDEVDYEAELAIVIGRRARFVPEDEALAYVLGYTCANDVSARDCQRSDRQWARAKGFDTFCPLGPWIVTREALDPDHCVIRSRLNGRTMQDASTREMIHSCARLVSYLSRQFTLLPGTLILTGTPAGVGMARNPPVFLRPGDRIEVEIEGIGTLANTVAAGRDS
jgi:2-keto-4-pentenoate hydratase/2-oxohepta-3-ene-1,7-dioic acid hydratase in catechol pathway